MKGKILRSSIGALVALLMASVTHAALIVTSVEAGGDVVFSTEGGGSLDLTGLNRDLHENPQSNI